jgi:hypothetical protein
VEHAGENLSCPFACREGGDYFTEHQIRGYRPELTRVIAVVAIIAEYKILAA